MVNSRFGADVCVVIAYENRRRRGGNLNNRRRV